MIGESQKYCIVFNNSIIFNHPLLCHFLAQKTSSKMILKNLLFPLVFLGPVSSFVAPLVKGPNRAIRETLELAAADHHGEMIDRRSWLSITTKILPGIFVGSLFEPLVANADGKEKIVVMGGAGYVGSRVSAGLYDQGYDVISVSRSSASEQAAKIKANVGRSIPIQYVSIDATKDDLSQVMKGASVVVSCVGIPPWEKSTARAGNGVANVRIAEAAKAAGVDKFVYVSVAKEFSSGPGKFLFSEFFQGKAEAEAAALKNFGDKAVFVKPGLIDGAPPGELRPPGPPGLAAISPDAVATAAISAAMGKWSGSLDGFNAIMAAVK